jgi:hypothetical protein
VEKRPALYLKSLKEYSEDVVGRIENFNGLASEGKN